MGAYVEATKVLPPQLVEDQIDRWVAGKEALASLNKVAFKRGIELYKRVC